MQSSMLPAVCHLCPILKKILAAQVRRIHEPLTPIPVSIQKTVNHWWVERQLMNTPDSSLAALQESRSTKLPYIWEQVTHV